MELQDDSDDNSSNSRIPNEDKSKSNSNILDAQTQYDSQDSQESQNSMSDNEINNDIGKSILFNCSDNEEDENNNDLIIKGDISELEKIILESCGNADNLMVPLIAKIKSTKVFKEFAKNYKSNNMSINDNYDDKVLNDFLFQKNNELLDDQSNEVKTEVVEKFEYCDNNYYFDKEKKHPLFMFAVRNKNKFTKQCSYDIFINFLTKMKQYTNVSRKWKNHFIMSMDINKDKIITNRYKLDNGNNHLLYGELIANDVIKYKINEHKMLVLTSYCMSMFNMVLQYKFHVWLMGVK